MSSQRPSRALIENLVGRFQQAGWLEEGTMTEVTPIAEDASFSVALSPKGIERLKSLHLILVRELRAPPPDELWALVRLLDYCQKKYYPNG